MRAQRVKKMVVPAVGLVMAIGIVTGCGGGDSGGAQESNPATSSAVATTTQASARDLGEPKPSGIEGLPVPSSAIKAEWSKPDNEGWRVPGTTREALVTWYRQHVPVGEDWRGWPWCRYKELSETTQWYWVRGAERDLTLLVVPQDNPLGIVLATGEAYERC